MKNLLLSFVFVVSLYNCQDRKIVTENNSVKNIDDPMIKANKGLVDRDNERIIAYISRRNYNMLQSNTGLWYEIFYRGNNKKAKKGNIITLNYNLMLLDGRYCYSSDSLGPLIFKIGYGGVESGLEEAVLMLGVGDKARFILPPHLAHGLMGDGKKIPRRSTIIYEVEVLKIDN